MERDLSSNEEELPEEEYIDMDIISTPFLCYTTTASSPSHSREFEFQPSTTQVEKESINSPADELFYKGKLLPLHLPPRLQMVEKLLSNPSEESGPDTGAISSTSANTPFESCNVSPSTSCHVSGELNREEFFECSAEFPDPPPKKSWSKKLKLIKQASLGLKLKASRAYLMSLFAKSASSDESCQVSKAKDCSSGNGKAGRKIPFAQTRRESWKIDIDKKLADDTSHRRSFSGAINHLPLTKHSSPPSSSSSSCSSSSSSSFSNSTPNVHHGLPVLKRSSSVNSEAESPIQGAIAHCKKSHQLVPARKSLSDVGCCSVSAARIAAASESNNRPGICRG